MVGLIDQLVLEQFDDTGESLGCWRVINTDQESELANAEEILYNLKAQGINHDIVVNFIDMIESSKLQLLEKRADSLMEIEADDFVENEILPFFQTDLLLEEIANLKLVTSERTKRLTVEQQTRSVDKDRYSALAYVLWYIQNYEKIFEQHSEDISEFLLIN